MGGVTLDINQDPQTGEKAPKQNPRLVCLPDLIGKKVQSQKKVVAANHYISILHLGGVGFFAPAKKQAMALDGKT